MQWDKAVREKMEIFYADDDSNKNRWRKNRNVDDDEDDYEKKGGLS